MLGFAIETHVGSVKAIIVDQDFLVRKDLVSALVAILSEGIQGGQLDDSEKVLSAISILNPKLECIDEFKAYIAIKRGFIKEALQSYTAAPVETSKWHAMMALCLKLAGDPIWNWHATKSLDLEDVMSGYSHALARTLLGLEPKEPDSNPADSSKGSAPQYPDSYTNYLAV